MNEPLREHNAFVPPTEKLSRKVVQVSTRRLTDASILPPAEEVAIELARDKTSEPIKSVRDVLRIARYLRRRGRYRDHMLFICGVNFGLRVSDLLQLRFSHLLHEDGTFRTSFPILERKTINTRKARKNRTIVINSAVIDAVEMYIRNAQKPCRLSDFLFRSESNNGAEYNRPLDRRSVDRILKNIGSELKLDIHLATHSLRKTFAYHQMLMSNNDTRKLLLLQKMFGHSSSVHTLSYIGITNQEIADAYLSLNLGAEPNP